MPYLPSFYEEILDFVELTDTETAEIISIEQAVQQLFDNQFVMTSSEQGIKRREKILGIQADSATETLDFRRKRIINRYSTKPPFTMRYLQERLDFLVGAGRAIISVDVQNFVLTVTVGIDEAAVFKEVEHTVKTTKPANMVYRQNTALGDSLSFEEHISTRALTRMTRLGTAWKLGSTPFAIVEPEVIVK